MCFNVQWETPGENKCRCAAANTQCVSRDKMSRLFDADVQVCGDIRQDSHHDEFGDS